MNNQDQKSPMRANLSFSVLLDRVPTTLKTLVGQEGVRLANIVNQWEKQLLSFVEDDDESFARFADNLRICEQAIEDIGDVLSQCRNIAGGYLNRNQLAEEVEAPPVEVSPNITVDQLNGKVEELNRFGDFLHKINLQEQEELLNTDQLLEDSSGNNESIGDG